MYRTWEKMDPDHRARVLAEADTLLARLEAGEVV
jgi:deoxyribodipyrimidine photolyase-related protein